MNREEVEITGCGSEMQGVGRLSDGLAVFVPFAIPGERAEIEVLERRDRFAKARLIRVLRASEDRVLPFCPYYQTCGGCQTQHIAYARALSLKRQKVYDALVRVGGAENPKVLETIPSPGERAYRNKAEFAFDDHGAGVYEGGTHRVIRIDACPLQSPLANRALAYVQENRGRLPLRYLVTRVNEAGEMIAVLSLYAPVDAAAFARKMMSALPFLKGVYSCRLSGRPAHALDGACTLLCGEERIRETLCGRTFSVSPKSFFQVNHAQTETLYAEALKLANLSPDDEIADVYCGAGAISLAAAGLCRRVTGIEIVPEAIRDAKENAEINGLSEKTEFVCGDAACVYPKLHRQRHFSTVIVDPPRKGMDAPVVSALLQSPAERVVYVSCNPATLARDVKALCANQTYRLVSAQPVDMFPQTEHVETVVLMSRADAAGRYPDGERCQ